MSTHTIAIRYNSASQTIAVFPDALEVKRGDTVIWDNGNPDVKWIKIKGANHPFIPGLPSGNWNGIPVIIRSNAPYKTWKYSVDYKVGNRVFSLDPKISVKPNTSIGVLMQSKKAVRLLFIAVTLILSAFIFFVRKDQQKRR